MIPEVFIQGVLYVVAGAFTGLMSGTLGIGGGVVVVPALLMIFHYNPLIQAPLDMPIAVATSLAIMVFTSLSSAHAHYRQGDIFWGVFRSLGGGIAIGTVAGGVLAMYIPTKWLKLFLMFFLLLVAGIMFFDRHTVRMQRLLPPWINALVSFLIGLQSGLLGLGGGVLLIPYLAWCGLDMRKIVGVTALCTLTVSVTGTLVFIIEGWNTPGLPPWSSGYVNWLAVLCMAIPSMIIAPIGARLAHVLPVHQLKLCFIVFLIITAIAMLYHAIGSL